MMKKMIGLLILAMIMFNALFFTQEESFPVMEGPYFGLQPPGEEPLRFAPGFLSSSDYDITPTFSPTLDEVFFGRRPTEEGRDNKLYYSTRVNNRWQKPLPAPFSSGAVEYEAQFSVDGKTLFFNRGRRLYFSNKSDGTWGEPCMLKPPVDEGMCVAPARNGTLYFTAARNRTYGIFRSRLMEGRYEEPEIVIPMAAHPWIDPDESFMVFDKYDISGGVQTSKLYVSFMKKDGIWSDPAELDKRINATGTELIPKISPDGKYLFFQRKVNGNTDIYWVDAGVVVKEKTSSR